MALGVDVSHFTIYSGLLLKYSNLIISNRLNQERISHLPFHSLAISIKSSEDQSFLNHAITSGPRNRESWRVSNDIFFTERNGHEQDIDHRAWLVERGLCVPLQVLDKTEWGVYCLKKTGVLHTILRFEEDSLSLVEFAHFFYYWVWNTTKNYLK